MLIPFYVVINEKGFSKAGKFANGVGIDRGEIALRIEIELDDDVFTTPPIPTVKIRADRSMLMQNLTVEGD